MEQMLNVVPVETDLLKLDELQRILDNRNQLEYWYSGYEFCLSREPIPMVTITLIPVPMLTYWIIELCP